MRAPDEKFEFAGYTDTQWDAIGVDLASWPSARKFLTYIADVYAGMPARRSTPAWQRVQRRQQLRAALVAARAALDHPDLGLGGQFAAPRRQARAALDVVIANINMAITRPRTGNKNAEQWHIQYWRELAEVYKEVRPEHSAKDLIAFVHACSRPVFPHATTAEAVTSFAYRFCKRARV
jgi:hypothetical protein